MKILHIIFSLGIGGAENMLVDIINEQAKFEKISLIVINDLVENNILNKISENINVKLFKRKPKSLPLNVFIKLNFQLLKENYNIIHCHNENLIKLILPYFKSKTCLTVHDTRSNTNNFSKYKRLFSISNSVQEDIYKRSNIESTVVYNGINLNSIQKKTSFKPHPLKIIQVGRLIHNKKGQDIILKTIAETEINAELYFIGAGESKEYLFNLAKKLKIENKVYFLGSKTREYVYMNLKNYDLLIQPSIFEGFGLTVIEAIAAKVPVLVSNIEGPMEIINNGKYGYFFKSNDFQDLKEKLHLILNEYEDLSIINKIESAFLHISSKFNITLTAMNYLKYYKNL